MENSETIEERFDSLTDYRRQIALALDRAVQHIDWFDRDLADCDLRNPDNIARLQRFLALSPGNRLRILVHDSAFLSHHCARLLQLFDTHTSSIAVRLSDETCRQVDDAFLRVDEWVVRRFQIDHPRGAAGGDPRALTLCQQRFEAMWAQASPLSEWRRLRL